MRQYIPPNAYVLPPQAERVFKGVIHDVYQWEQIVYDGSEATFEMVKRPDTVVALLIKGDSIVIAREEQPGKRLRLQLPGGRADVEEETELDAIRREVMEETGMTFRTWKLIAAHQPLPTKVDYFYYFFIAYDFEKQLEQSLDGGEKVTTMELELNELKDIIREGELEEAVPQSVIRANSIDELKAIQPLYIYEQS